MIIALILVLLLALAYGALQGLLGHGPFRFLNTMYLKSLPGNAEIYRPENVAPVENSPLSGMNLCFLGSSVTLGATSLETSFAEYIAVRNNCTYVKEAVSGTTLADNDKNSYIQRMLHNIDPNAQFDAFICQLSTNDASSAIPLGEISSSRNLEDFDTKTVLGALEYIIVYADTTWHCPVVFYTGTQYDSPAYGKMVEQLLKIENIAKINEFAEVFRENVETDLTLQNILWFAKAAFTGGLKAEDVEFVTMPNKNVSAWSRTYQSYQSYVVPIADELLDLVNNQLSPFTKVFTLSDLDIMSVNSDGSLNSSTGRVEDSRAAQPPVRPSKPSTPEQPEEETPTVDENGNAIDPDTGLPVTGGETTDPGTTDPGTGETTPGTTGPGTGETTPGTGTTDPGTSETTPGTTDPGTGGTTPGTTDPGTGGTTDSGAGTSGGDSQTAGTGDSGGSTAAPDAGFVIVN